MIFSKSTTPILDLPCLVECWLIITFHKPDISDADYLMEFSFNFEVNNSVGFKINELKEIFLLWSLWKTSREFEKHREVVASHHSIAILKHTKWHATSYY